MIKKEPVLITAAIQATLGLLGAFGFGLTGEQVSAIMTLSGTLLALWTRSKVSPV